MSPLDRLARIVTWGFIVSVTLAIGYVGYPAVSALLVSRAETTGELLGLADLHLAVRRSLLAAAGLAALATGGFLVAWLRRARAQLTGLSGAVPRLAARWATWAWFIPVVNLVLPALVVAEVARESLPPGDRDERDRANLRVGAWWPATLVGLLLCDRVGWPVAWAVGGGDGWWTVVWRLALRRLAFSLAVGTRPGRQWGRAQSAAGALRLPGGRPRASPTAHRGMAPAAAADLLP